MRLVPPALLLLSSLLLASGSFANVKRVLPGSLVRQMDKTNGAKLWRLILTSMKQPDGERPEEELKKLIKELTDERLVAPIADDTLR